MHREAKDDSRKDPEIAGLPQIGIYAMRTNTIQPRVAAQWRIAVIIVCLGYTLTPFASAVASEIATLEPESQSFDLDAGTVAEPAPEDMTEPAGADIQLVYNADRTPHTVVIPVAEGVEMSFVASVGFDGISSSDIPNLVFSRKPPDLPFLANDCVVIRTDQGAVFKIGNPVESGMGITFDYEQLQ